MEKLDAIFELLTIQKKSKKASELSDADFQSLSIGAYRLDDNFWSTMERKLPLDLLASLEPVVAQVTAKAVGLIRTNKTAEIKYVQPLVKQMINGLIAIVNGSWKTDFGLADEVYFNRSLPANGERLHVTGKADAVIFDNSTHLPVMSWEFENLKDGLTKRNIAQLAAAMWDAICRCGEMGTSPAKAVGFLTSGRQWVMLIASFVEGAYVWAATPVLATIGANNEVDVGICGKVAKLLCGAFLNARQLHQVGNATLSKVIYSFTDHDGENGSNPPDGDPDGDADADDSHGADAVDTSHRGVGSGNVGLVLSSETRRRPLGPLDANCAAPLTLRNVEKYDAMVGAQTPLDRFREATSRGFGVVG